MTLGLIYKELDEELLDVKNNQNQTDGVEKLKHYLSQLDMRLVPSESIEEFIQFFSGVLDNRDSKVLTGTLKVINVLIQKLGSSLDQYFTQIALLAVKALGDPHTVTKTEYKNVFRQLMEIVAPQKVLDLIVGSLSHKKSRVREDVLNIITAALLSHPGREFNIPKLCSVVAPYLADGKLKVRQAALELFAVFDYCLEQPLTTAVDMVELNEDAKGLMAAVQARRARHLLPRLSPEWNVEYTLVVPKPGQRCSPQLGSADLDWVLHRGPVSSARSKPESGRLGSLTDNLHRSIASAGKGKRKFPWETSCENEQPRGLQNGKSSGKIDASDESLSVSRSPETYVPSFASDVPTKRQSRRRRDSQSRLRRSRSLDPDIFRSIKSGEYSPQPNLAERSPTFPSPLSMGTPRACVIPGTPGVERTFSLPAIPKTPGSFLLPSYPLAGLPGGLPSPTLTCGPADQALSTSHIWPYKKEGMALQPKPGPCSRDPAGKGRGSSQRDKTSHEVGVIGQRTTYSNGQMDCDDGVHTVEASPPLVRTRFGEPIRAMRPAKGLQNSSSSSFEMPEGVVGRGASFPDSMSERPSNGRLSRGKLRGQQESLPQGERQLNGCRPAPSQTLSADAQQDQLLFDSRDSQLNGSTLNSAMAGSLARETPVSPPGSQSPPPQPCPPTVPPNHPKTSVRLRRAPGLKRTRPSLSHSSDELAQGNLGRRQDARDTPELPSFPKPEQTLTQSFSLIASEDWEKKVEGLKLLRSLAQNHADTLKARVHDICLALVQEVKNLRSAVAHEALCTLGALYSHLRRAMDPEVEVTARALLQVAAESNAFLRQGVDAALGHMVQNCTAARCFNGLLKGGLSNLNAKVRKCAAQHFADLLEKVGVTSALSAERVLPAVVRLAQDSSQEPRHYGRWMLLFLSSHKDFDKILQKDVPTEDLPAARDIICKLKGLGGMPKDPPSARGKRPPPGSGALLAPPLNRQPLKNAVDSGYSSTTSARESKSQAKPQRYHKLADKVEYMTQLKALLESKDFRERIRGIDQLVADCQNNPSMVTDNLYTVFDCFSALLLECNSKVNQHALESLQKMVRLLKDDMSQVVTLLVPAIAVNHLNSKNSAVHAAATGALSELMLNLDNGLLLQPFCTQARFINGTAKVDLVDKVAELVTKLYLCRPQLVEQKALPLMWCLLCPSNQSSQGEGIRRATASLCRALHAAMGPGLAERAGAQPQDVRTAFSELLRKTTHPEKCPRTRLI